MCHLWTQCCFWLLAHVIHCRSENIDLLVYERLKTQIWHGIPPWSSSFSRSTSSTRTKEEVEVVEEEETYNSFEVGNENIEQPLIKNYSRCWKKILPNQRMSKAVNTADEVQRFRWNWAGQAFLEAKQEEAGRVQQGDHQPYGHCRDHGQSWAGWVHQPTKKEDSAINRQRSWAWKMVEEDVLVWEEGEWHQKSIRWPILKRRQIVLYIFIAIGDFPVLIFPILPQMKVWFKSEWPF